MRTDTKDRASASAIHARFGYTSARGAAAPSTASRPPTAAGTPTTAGPLPRQKKYAAAASSTRPTLTPNCLSFGQDFLLTQPSDDKTPYYSARIPWSAP